MAAACGGFHNSSAPATAEAERQSYIASYLRALYYSPEPAKYMYEHEARLNPRVSDSLRGHEALATSDLLECHAAVLTELYISNHRASRPDLYDREKDEDLADAFRVESMEKYNRPWKLFRKILNPLLGLDRLNIVPDHAHPMFRECPRALEYALLAFVLEYALHVAPGPQAADVDFSTRSVYWEDFNPAVRFTKLLYALRLDIASGGFLNFGTLYSKTAARLAKWIDVNNLLAISENRGMAVNSQPPVQELFPLNRPEVLKRLDLESAPVTFPSLADTTEQWLERYRNIETPPDVYRLSATRLVAMRLRSKQPDIFRAWLPANFFAEIGLPHFFQTANGIQAGPTFTIEKLVEKSKLDIHDPAFRRFGTVTVHEQADGNFVVLECHPGVPCVFLDQVVRREILLKLCENVEYGIPLACPLAVGRLAVCGCTGRRQGCARINTPDELPVADCAARALHDKYLKECSKNGTFNGRIRGSL